MKKMFTVMAMVIALALSALAPAMASNVTPSTNEENREKDWAHFHVLETRVGEIDVEFVSTRSFASCFEYRSDGEGPMFEDNFNTDIDDGLWPFVCVNDSIETLTLEADEFVEIRMVFGAERDERFDWTRVDVPQPGHQGREKAQSTPAGERANENSRLNR